jgi:hypothetical protein
MTDEIIIRVDAVKLLPLVLLCIALATEVTSTVTASPQFMIALHCKVELSSCISPVFERTAFLHYLIEPLDLLVFDP